MSILAHFLFIGSSLFVLLLLNNIFCLWYSLSLLKDMIKDWFFHFTEPMKCRVKLILHSFLYININIYIDWITFLLNNLYSIYFTFRKWLFYYGIVLYWKTKTVKMITFWRVMMSWEFDKPRNYHQLSLKHLSSYPLFTFCKDMGNKHSFRFVKSYNLKTLVKRKIIM